MPKPTRGLLLALEELESAMPKNDTSEMIAVDPENPQAAGDEKEMKNLAGKEGSEKNTEADSLPENDTTKQLQTDPENPASQGKVVDVTLVEKGKATESGINPIKNAVAQESDGNPMPKNDTEGLVQPDPENPNSVGKVEDATLVEKGKATESGIAPIKTKDGEVAQESDGTPMPKNDTSGLVQPNPENPHSEGAVKDSTLVEKGKETESGIQPIKGAVAQEADGTPMPKNDTSGLIAQDPENPHADGKEESLTLVEKGKETESGIQVVMEELEQIDSNLEQAEDIVSELEKYRDIVEGAQGQEMNYVASDILQTALENLYTRAGFDKPMGRIVPALEDNSGGITCKRAATVALEDMDKKKSSLVDKIILVLKHKFRLPLKVISLAVSGVTAIANGARKLMDTSKNYTPKEGTISDASISKFFAVQNPGQAYSVTLQSANKIFQALQAEINRGIAAAMNTAKAKQDRSAVDRLFAANGNDIDKVLNLPAMLGNYRVEVDDDGTDILLYTNFDNSAAGFKEAGAVPYLSKQDFDLVLKGVLQSEQLVKNVDGYIKKIEAQLTQVAAQLNKTGDDGQKDKYVRLAVAQINIYLKAMGELTAYLQQTATAGYSYASKSFAGK